MVMNECPFVDGQNSSANTSAHDFAMPHFNYLGKRRTCVNVKPVING